VLAGVARLGFVANFLSRPVLVGFLAGVALSLIIGQISRLTGVRIESDGLIRPLIELAAKLGQVHLMTLAVGLGLFLLLRLMRRFAPQVPGPLTAVVVGMALTYAADLPQHDVAVVGAIHVSAPTFGVRWPAHLAVNELLLSAMGILLVSFGSGIVTARSFGAKNRYDVDGNPTPGPLSMTPSGARPSLRRSSRRPRWRWLSSRLGVRLPICPSPRWAPYSPRRLSTWSTSRRSRCCGV
jgi:MFS superfamily sulfate permease-like transporter